MVNVLSLFFHLRIGDLPPAKVNLMAENQIRLTLISQS